MKCKILHESKGRLRVHLFCGKMSLDNADVLEYYLRAVNGVTDVSVYDRTCDAVIVFTDRKAVLKALAAFAFEKAQKMCLVPDHTSRKLNREFEDKLVMTVIARFISKTFIPAPIRAFIAVIRSWKYIKHGLKALLSGKLSVAVLDATAVTVSLLRGDFKTAASVMFMLNIGEILEDWTHKKSVADLAGAMSLNVENVWVKTGDTETLISINNVREGDLIVVRTGNMIPLDGKVAGGEATVNQASITGESLPVRKSEGSYVYAGTVVEAVKSGAIRHFFLVAGCDGAKPGRNYYTKFVKQTPSDSIVLTLACGKFRFNDLELGEIGGLPRLMDMGQCNDAYGAIQVAVALADAFGCSVNELPLSFVLSWYEQKAVCILLTLLHLGIKNIRLGPSLPAFLSPNILNYLVENYGIAPITTPEEDIKALMNQ